MWRETRSACRQHIYNLMCVSVFSMMQWGEWAETEPDFKICLNRMLSDSNWVNASLIIQNV